MKHLLQLVFILITLSSSGQVVIKKTLHQFGDIFAHSNRVVDFHIENRGTKDLEITKIDGPEALSCLVSNKVVKPGETVLFRVKYNPKEIGLFHEKVAVTFSASKTPIEFTVEGKSHYLPFGESLACPNFQTIEANLKIPFQMDVLIWDENTGKPVPNAKVKLYTKGLELKSMQANANGILKFNTFLGYYYFIVTADGYESKKFDEYVNHHNPDVLVRMSKIVEEDDPEEQDILAKAPLSIEDFDPKYKPVILFADEAPETEELAEETLEDVSDIAPIEAVVPESEPKALSLSPKEIAFDTLSYTFPSMGILRDRVNDAAVMVTPTEIVKPGGADIAASIERPKDLNRDFSIKKSDIRKDLNEMQEELEAEQEAEQLLLEKEAARLNAIANKERIQLEAIQEQKRKAEEKERERVLALEDAKAKRLEQARLLQAAKDKQEEMRRARAEEVIDLVPQLEKVMDANLALPTKDYKANNVVFLVDVSGSMAKDGKMELLKSSIIELLSSLRPMDRMALVSYSTDAQVLLSSSSAANTDSIIKVLMRLEAGGSSAGKKGLRVAYKEAKRNLIKDGNNMVIIATDGAFTNIDGMKFQVQKGKVRNIKLSVVGLRNREKTVDSMQDLARFGNGRYIHINSFQDSKQQLLEEIKFHSKK